MLGSIQLGQNFKIALFYVEQCVRHFERKMNEILVCVAFAAYSILTVGL